MLVDSLPEHELPDWPVLLLSLMMVVTPGLGVPSEALLQDTLKSMLVALFALGAAFMFFAGLRTAANQSIRWHLLLVLPLTLMGYALFSMHWSHAFLGGVEAIRWFVFSLIVFLGLNTLTPDKTTRLLWGIHLGATAACLWCALQFWLGLRLFPQSPPPASTFINRNFFAEFIVCTLPFSSYLMLRARTGLYILFFASTLALHTVALLATGTRSALVSLLLFAALLPFILYACRKQLARADLSNRQCSAIAVVFVGMFLILGSIPTWNPQITEGSGPISPFERAFGRAATIAHAEEYTQGSFSIRSKMWLATAHMIAAHPVSGVGAGACEVHISQYQDSAQLLETDYYPHNEILQLLAEYGVVGWAFLLGLVGYLLWAAYRTWRLPAGLDGSEKPLRAFTLASLLMLLLVSNAGFPWRLASTSALFALGLSILMASDARLAAGNPVKWTKLQPCSERLRQWMMWGVGFSTLLALYISFQAAECESKLTRALKVALTISRSVNPLDPSWEPAKAQLLQWTAEGIAINPHYRKLTPAIADELARWGDWQDANWIWESVAASRPFIPGITANLARGYIHTGDLKKAQESLEKTQILQPTAPSTANLRILLLSREDRMEEASSQLAALLRAGNFNEESIRLGYAIGMQTHNSELALLALRLNIQKSPAEAVGSWIRIGNIYETMAPKDPLQAQQSYQAAYSTTPPAQRASVMALIPEPYRAGIR